MGSLKLLNGPTMDFEIIDQSGDQLMLDSLKSTMVDMGETESRQSPAVLKHLNVINDYLLNHKRRGRTTTGIPFQIFAWSVDFDSQARPGQGGLKVIYTVICGSDLVERDDLKEFESSIYDMIEEVEAMMRAELRKVQEESGQEVHFI